VGGMTDYREPLVTRAELAQLMRISIRTVDMMIADGLPVHRWGMRLVRIKPSEAFAWAEGRDNERNAA